MRIYIDVLQVHGGLSTNIDQAEDFLYAGVETHLSIQSFRGNAEITSRMLSGAIFEIFCIVFLKSMFFSRSGLNSQVLKPPSHPTTTRI